MSTRKKTLLLGPSNYNRLPTTLPLQFSTYFDFTKWTDATPEQKNDPIFLNRFIRRKFKSARKLKKRFNANAVKLGACRARLRQEKIEVANMTDSLVLARQELKQAKTDIEKLQSELKLPKRNVEKLQALTRNSPSVRAAVAKSVSKKNSSKTPKPSNAKPVTISTKQILPGHYILPPAPPVTNTHPLQIQAVEQGLRDAWNMCQNTLNDKWQRHCRDILPDIIAEASIIAWHKAIVAMHRISLKTYQIGETDPDHITNRSLALGRWLGKHGQVDLESCAPQFLDPNSPTCILRPKDSEGRMLQDTFGYFKAIREGMKSCADMGPHPPTPDLTRYDPIAVPKDFTATAKQLFDRKTYSRQQLMKSRADIVDVGSDTHGSGYEEGSMPEGGDG